MKYSLEQLRIEARNKKRFDFLFFWGHLNRYGNEIGKHCLSQWYDSPFTVNGVLYKTAEHWMMYRKAMQFDDFQSAKKVLNTETPKDAKYIGRNIRSYDNDVWYLPSYEMVRLGNIHKFNQHPQLLEYLLQQKNKVLVEASPYDNKWGVALNANDRAIYDVEQWQGTNFLGFVLMEVRDFFYEFGTFDYLKDYLLRPSDYFKRSNMQDSFWLKQEAKDYKDKFEEYYNSLSQRQKVIFDICNPQK